MKLRGAPAPRDRVKPGHLVFGPIYKLLAERQMPKQRQIADWAGVDNSIVSSWYRHGITAYTADELCCRLGFLPFEVYGWRFFDPQLLREEAKRGNLRRLTDDDVRTVRRRARQGEKAGLISQAYGVTPQSIYQILNGKSYGDVR